MRQDHSLKEVIAIRTIELAGEHAAPFETEGQTHMDMDHFARVSRLVLCVRSRRGRRA
jgi:hypothetical protein